MKVNELASYFSKKIGKPIPYSYLQHQRDGLPPRDFRYTVEPIAVADGMLHALVTFKGQMIGDRPWAKRSLVNREIQVPIEDGDSATLVLTMAVAGIHIENYPEKWSSNEDIHGAYLLLHGRHEELSEEPQQPRM